MKEWEIGNGSKSMRKVKVIAGIIAVHGVVVRGNVLTNVPFGIKKPEFFFIL